jgi:hypothetical protein
MKAKTHKFIISNAVEKLDIDLFKKYKKYLLKGTRKADYSLSHLYVGSFTHYYDPIRKKGYFILNNAKNKGKKFFEKAIENYHKGKLKKSMIQLGIALHLIADSATPAHSKPKFHLPFLFKDDFENFINRNLILAELYVENIKATIKNSIEGFYEDLAKISKDYKQGKYGILASIQRLFGKKLKKNDLLIQTKELVPLSVSYTMGALQVFYEKIKK